MLFKKKKSIIPTSVSVVRPVIIIDDSKAIAMKLQNYVEKLGYSDVTIFENGKDAIKGCKKIFSKVIQLFC